MVTGVGGFIGSRVARRLVQDGVRVVGVDDFSSGHRSSVPPEVDLLEMDLSQPDVPKRLPRNCGLVLHLAGQSSGELSFRDPADDLRRNTVSTLNLIRYASENTVDRIVFASSMSVYGDVPDLPVRESDRTEPLSCYGIAKLASERYLRLYRETVPSVILRMFNVYGPGQDLSNNCQGMVSIYLAQALDTGTIEVRGALERFRDLVYIDDVVEVWIRAGLVDVALGETYNVATGVRTTVADLLEQLCVLIPGSSHQVLPGTPGDQSGIYADVSLLSRDLGLLCSTSLAVGLKRFVEWARQSVPSQAADLRCEGAPSQSAPPPNQ